MKSAIMGRVVMAAAAVSASILGTAVRAGAVTLPASTSSVEVIANVPTTTVVDDPTQASLTGASASVTRDPYVTLNTAVSDGAAAGQGAIATITYYFSITGGTPGTAVPIDVATRLTTDASAEPANNSTAFYGFAAIDVGSAPEVSVCTDPTQCAHSTFNGIISTSANAGDLLSLHLYIEASGDPFFAGVASASADPYIYIDPSFADAADYQVEVSAGIGNAIAPTPLPATLPLFATGILALGFAARRSLAV